MDNNNFNQQQNNNNYIDPTSVQLTSTVATTALKAGTSKLLVGIIAAVLVLGGGAALIFSAPKDEDKKDDSTTTTTTLKTDNNSVNNNEDNKLVVNQVENDNYDNVFESGIFAEYDSIYYSLGLMDVTRNGNSLTFTYVNEDAFYGTFTGEIKTRMDEYGENEEYVLVDHPNIKEIVASSGDIRITHNDSSYVYHLSPIDNDFSLNGIYNFDGDNHFVLLIEQDLDSDYSEEGYSLIIGHNDSPVIDIRKFAEFDKKNVNKYISIDGDKITLKNGFLPINDNNSYSVLIEKNGDNTYKFNYVIDGLYDEDGKYNKCTTDVEFCDYYDYLDGNYTRVK